MTDLGHLLLWRVGGEVNVDYDTLTKVLKDTGITLPPKPLPVDVFRRLSSLTRTYPIPDSSDVIECSLATVDSKNDNLLLRHIVTSVKHDGIALRHTKGGDVAFYFPPRGQWSKARMRVLTGGEYPEQAEQFGQVIREQYDKGVKGALEAQTIRRLVRTYLAERKALYLEGPYFIEYANSVSGLKPLFDLLGEDSYLHSLPVPDTPQQRAFLLRGFDKAIKAGNPVNEPLWNMLERR